MLDCFLAASCTCNDSNLCKSFSTSFPTLWKRHKFCEVFNAFVISTEPGFTTGNIVFFTDIFVWGPFSSSLKAWNLTPKLFTLSFRLTEDMLLTKRCWNKEKTNLRTKFCQCSYQHSNAWNEQYDPFENLIRMFEIAEGKQPKNDGRDRENCST